jgi:hypothetical protein
MRWLSLVLLLLLMACAAGPPPNPAGPFAASVGLSDQALIKRFGVPTRTYKIGAKTFFTYDQRHLVIMPGAPWGPPWGYPFYYPYGWGPSAYAYRTGCLVTLEIEHHIVRAVDVARGICE